VLSVPKPPSSLSPVRLLADGKTERDLLTSAIAAVESDGPLRVLEAGCGQRWPLEVEGRTLHITGVDTDAEAMRIRREKHADLDVEMVADLRADRDSGPGRGLRIRSARQALTAPIARAVQALRRRQSACGHAGTRALSHDL